MFPPAGTVQTQLDAPERLNGELPMPSAILIALGLLSGQAHLSDPHAQSPVCPAIGQDPPQFICWLNPPDVGRVLRKVDSLHRGVSFNATLSVCGIDRVHQQVHGGLRIATWDIEVFEYQLSKGYRLVLTFKRLPTDRLSLDGAQIH